MNTRRSTCPSVELAPGYSISPLITGCWQLAADHGAASVEFELLVERWRRALAAGYTTFDCADIYTGVEELLGRFLRRLDDSSAVRIHTKYVPDLGNLARVDRPAIVRAIDQSLAGLGREQLDLVQFHWWDYAVPGYVETALVLDELRQAGKIRYLGLTNFDLERLREIVAAGVEVVAVQVQYSVLDRRPENGLAEWCRQHGIGLLCYGTLAGGFLSDAYRGVPEPPERAANRSLVKYALILDELGGWSALQEILDPLAAIAGRRGVPLATAAIRWVLERPGVAAAVVGVSRRERSDTFGRLWSQAWSEQDWSELDAVLARYPGPTGAVYGLEREPAGPHLAILRMNLKEG
ncbi:MAG: aldo/keto reductase [Acidobacteria bacterium]|nr:aldo/keto reductase [Acidobacteriota bacterium]